MQYNLEIFEKFVWLKLGKNWTQGGVTPLKGYQMKDSI